MLLTLWCILVTIGSLFFFGLPVATVLNDTNTESGRLWLVAPFLGLGIIILVLQNLVYLNVQVGISAPFLWILGILLWGGLIATGRLPKVLASVPRSVLFLALVVYLLQGVGLLYIGARYYVARAWWDQFNYTAIAQFLVDYPFNTTYADIHNQPFLVTAINLKTDRIGVSILQGFLGVSTFTDSKTVFESVILLAPSLIMLAIYDLVRRLDLSPRVIAFAVLGAGLVPAVTAVHVETFFSQALGMPYLLILPLFVADLVKRVTWKRLLITALILATGISVYTEFYPIFVGTIGLVLGFDVLRRHLKILDAVSIFLLVNGIALLMNIGALSTVFAILGRVAAPDILANIYLWAFTLEGLGRLWLGDIVFLGRVTAWLWTWYSAFSIGLLAIAYLGLGWFFGQRKDSLSLSILVLAILPLGLGLSHQYPYQFYKLLLSTSPLLIVGMAVFFSKIESAWHSHELLLNLTRISMVALILIFCVGTIGTTLVAGVLPVGGRSIGAIRLLSSGAEQAQELLSAMHGQNIFIVSQDSFMNAWLAYFSRHNRVWLSNPKIGDISVEGIQTFSDLPDDVVVLTSAADDGITDSSIVPSWSAKPYQLGRVSNKNWAVLLAIRNPNGLEDWSGEPGLWLGGGDTEIDFVSSKEGQATITGEFTRGPSLLFAQERQFTIRANQNYSDTLTISVDGMKSFSIPVVAGPNRLILRSLDKPSISELPNGDARPLLLGIRGLSVSRIERNP